MTGGAASTSEHTVEEEDEHLEGSLERSTDIPSPSAAVNDSGLFFGTVIGNFWSIQMVKKLMEFPPRSRRGDEEGRLVPLPEDHIPDSEPHDTGRRVADQLAPGL